jgi:hypothetical protein
VSCVYVRQQGNENQKWRTERDPSGCYDDRTEPVAKRKRCDEGEENPTDSKQIEMRSTSAKLITFRVRGDTVSYQFYDEP